MIKEVIKAIAEHHHYKITAEYFGRIGAINKRYGHETVVEAVKSIAEKEIPLTDFLNILERRCQFIAENGKMDDLTQMIFGSND